MHLKRQLGRRPGGAGGPRPSEARPCAQPLHGAPSLTGTHGSMTWRPRESVSLAPQESHSKGSCRCRGRPTKTPRPPTALDRHSARAAAPVTPQGPPASRCRCPTQATPHGHAVLTVLLGSFKKRSYGAQVAFVPQEQRLDLPLPRRGPCSATQPEAASPPDKGGLPPNSALVHGAVCTRGIQGPIV